MLHKLGFMPNTGAVSQILFLRTEAYIGSILSKLCIHTVHFTQYICTQCTLLYILHSDVHYPQYTVHVLILLKSAILLNAFLLIYCFEVYFCSI